MVWDMDASSDVWCPGWRLCFPSCVLWEHPAGSTDTGVTSPTVRWLLLEAASHKQGSKISLEIDLSTCAASLCLIKTGWKCSPELAVSEQDPQQSSTSITVTALAFPFVTLYSFLAFCHMFFSGSCGIQDRKTALFFNEEVTVLQSFLFVITKCAETPDSCFLSYSKNEVS